MRVSPAKGRCGALFCFLLACHGADAATASGRNWRLAVDTLGCEGRLLQIGARIDYLGPKGPVEAPVNRLVDAEGRTYLPKSLVWKSGDKRLAQWLSAGGVANVQTERLGEFQLKFDIGAAPSTLRLEFGDIRAFALTRKGGCLRPTEIRAPRKPDASNAGHRFLPNAREIDLPMGRAPAQPYFYRGADDLAAVESAARQAIAADFPQYRSEKFFFFNWGTQKSQSGNDVYSIGIYEVRPCP